MKLQEKQLLKVSKCKKKRKINKDWYVLNWIILFQNMISDEDADIARVIEQSLQTNKGYEGGGNYEPLNPEQR